MSGEGSDPPPRSMDIGMLSRLVYNNLPKSLHEEYFNRRRKILAEGNRRLRRPARLGGYVSDGSAWDDPEVLFTLMQLYLELSTRVDKHIGAWVGGESPSTKQENE